MESKKILVIANVASMIVQFNMRNLKILQELKYEIDVTCNFKEGNTCTKEILEELKYNLKNMSINSYQIDFARGMSNVKGQLHSIKQVDELVRKNKYDVIFVQSTIASIAARLARKKYGAKIIYVAHGFQFYKGASKTRWALFYNIEKILARRTDTLILTNQDDYILAKKHFHARNILFVPGVGVNIHDYEIDNSFNRNKERIKRGIEPDDYVIFSAGELSERKNHRIVMEVVHEMNNPKIKYIICGIGPLEKEYRNLIKSWKMEGQIYLLGYQKDLKGIYGISDLFVLPSINEGLPVCLLMSIAAKVNSICSDIRGNHELVKDKRYLFPPTDKKYIRNCIEYSMNHGEENVKIIEENYLNLAKYSSENVDELMKKVFKKYR